MLVVSVLTWCCGFILRLRSYYSQIVVHTDDINEMIFRNMTQVDRDQHDIVVTTSSILPSNSRWNHNVRLKTEHARNRAPHIWPPFEATCVAFSSARLETPPEYTIFEFSGWCAPNLSMWRCTFAFISRLLKAHQSMATRAFAPSCWQLSTTPQRAIVNNKHNCGHWPQCWAFNPNSTSSIHGYSLHLIWIGALPDRLRWRMLHL